MKPRPDSLNIIAIHGVPRSGTSWLGQILNSSSEVTYRFQPLFSYAFKSRLNEVSLKEDIDSFFSDLLHTSDSFVLKAYASETSPPNINLQKKAQPTHLAYKEVRYHHILANLIAQTSNVKVIGIVRNPCSVINSWIRAPKEFKTEWDPIEEWRYAFKKNMGRTEEFNGFEKWKEVTRIFLALSKTYRDRFYLLKYSDLNKDPLKTSNDLFNFCSLPFEQQTVDFIHKSTQTDDPDPYGIFRKDQNDNKWKLELDERISHAIINDLKYTDLEQFL